MVKAKVLSKLCAFALLLPLPPCVVEAAAVRWFIQHENGDSHNIIGRIWGDDTNGLAGGQLTFRPSFPSPWPDRRLDLLNSSWVSPFETLETSFSSDAISVEMRIDKKGLGLQDFVKVGTLSIPGSTQISPFGTRWSLLDPYEFDQTQTFLYQSGTGEEIIRDQRMVSSSFRGGGLAVDAVLDLFPSTIDFGEVEIGSTRRLEDILFLANGGFGGPSLNITSVSVTGANADDFAAPDLVPTILTNDPNIYDLTFSPKITGDSLAMLEIGYETEHFPSSQGGVMLRGRGVPAAVPEPSGTSLLGLGGLLLLATRRGVPVGRIPRSAADRHWTFARAWLQTEVRGR